MKIYAHRGSSMEHPELTLAAFKAAIDDGADGFECDVRLTKDDQLVLWHDADLKRITGHSGLISNLNFHEIKRIYPETISLEELLALARDYKKEIAIETKHPVATGSAVENKVMELLAQENLSTDVHIMSFSWLALEKIRMINPKQSTVALLGNRFNGLMQRFTSAGSIAPSIQLFRENPEIRHDKRNIFVWTVDDADDMRFCADNGVDVLITNTPLYARSVLGYH